MSNETDTTDGSTKKHLRICQCRGHQEPTLDRAYRRSCSHCHPDWARPRQTTYKGASLDEAMPAKATQRETETTAVGGDDETSRPHI